MKVDCSRWRGDEHVAGHLQPDRQTLILGGLCNPHYIPRPLKQTMLPYKYRPLVSSKTEIRVVRFPEAVGTNESIVTCTIQHVSLDRNSRLRKNGGWKVATNSALDTDRVIEFDYWRWDEKFIDFPTHTGRTVSTCPRYLWGDFEAVSYCWESDVRDKKVLIDGHIVWVPTNLEAML